MRKKLFIVGLIVVILLTGCKNKKNHQQEEIKTIEDKIIGELKFSNTSLTSTDNSAQLVTQITNESSKDIEVNTFNIYVKDKDDKTIVVLQGYVGSVIHPKEQRKITSNVNVGLNNAYDIEYEIVDND